MMNLIRGLFALLLILWTFTFGNGIKTGLEETDVD